VTFCLVSYGHTSQRHILRKPTGRRLVISACCGHRKVDRWPVRSISNP